jgi:hypothetical protein
MAGTAWSSRERMSRLASGAGPGRRFASTAIPVLERIGGATFHPILPRN